MSPDVEHSGHQNQSGYNVAMLLLWIIPLITVNTIVLTVKVSPKDPGPVTEVYIITMVT
jgi:hypothetical protein